MKTQTKEEVVQEFRVQSIQDAAMRVIGRKGMAAATMAEIAREAGVAKGTIYLYFRDRDELVEKTFETAIAQLHERIDEALANDLPFEKKLRGIVSAQLAFFREHAEFFRLYLSLRLNEGNGHHPQRHAKRTCHSQYRSRVEAFAAVLSSAMERGEIRRGDPYRLALFLVEGSTAITLERLNEDAPPPEDQDADLIVSLILHGLDVRSQKRSSI